MTTTPTPHDCFFRENFARPVIARDFLRHHLPAALLPELDLERMSISPDTFVTKALRKIYTLSKAPGAWMSSKCAPYLNRPSPENR
jgi:hypothetical protein